jgi:CubicO group peptidase (beta-lactamase class C family)
MEMVRAARERNGLSAILCGIWIGDRELLTLADGESMTRIPATLRMHFRAGGITEICECTLLLRYVDRRIVSLDAPLSRWLPELPESNTVTLRMLANSTAGYPDYVPARSFVDAFYSDPFREWTARELIDIGLAAPRRFAPGKNWEYSHTNFVILGEALQKIGRAPMRELMKREITGPLGLRETDFPTTPDIAPPVLHTFDSERGRFEDSTYWNPSWVSHSGRIISTLADLGTLARAVGAGTLLSAKSRREMVAPTTVGLGPNRADFYFGMGIGMANGWMLQNPAFGGFSAIFAHLPSRKISIVIVSTLGRTSDASIHYSTPIFKQMVQYLTPDTPIPDRFK